MRSIGEYLKVRREDCNIKEDYSFQKRWLNPRIVKALEADDYSFFKGYFYYINFLKDYLRTIGDDENQFISDFEDELDFIRKENFSTGIYFPGVRYSKFKNRNLFIKLFAVLIFLLFMLLLYFNDESVKKILGIKVIKPEAIPATFLDSSPEDILDYNFYPVNVKMTFSNNCWARIRRGNVVAAEKIFLGGDRFEIRGYNIILDIGNPSALTLTVNGEKIENFKNKGGFVKILLNPATLERYK